MEPINYGKEKDNEIQLWFTEKPFWNFYEFFNYSVMFKLVGDLKELYENCYNCQKFGEIIYKTKKIEISDFMEVEKFKVVFSGLIEVFQNGGIFNSYIQFFKWIFGEQTEVNIDVVAPCCISVKISNYKKIFFRILENMNEYRQTEDKNYYRIGFSSLLDISVNKMLSYLQTFLPTGYYIDFEFFN